MPTVVLCVLVGLNFVAQYEGGSGARGSSASWSSQVHAGTEACLKAGTRDAELSTAPGGHWKVDVPCRDLLNG